MYCLNKIVTLLTSPAFVGLCLLVVAFGVALWGRRKATCCLAGMAALWFLVWTSPVTYHWLASGLERQFPVMTVEETPQADAIRILGGGVASNTNKYPYSEMWTSADRVWHGARLYRAGKAPRVFVTCEAEVPLLVDFGVPREAITICENARNTEEEARFIADALKNRTESEGGREFIQRAQPSSKPRVLLVTSAWHMRRAMLLFRRYAPEVEVVPAAIDYEALVRCGWKANLKWDDLVPSAEMMFQNSYMIKEIIGYWCYRLKFWLQGR